MIKVFLVVLLVGVFTESDSNADANSDKDIACKTYRVLKKQYKEALETSSTVTMGGASSAVVGGALILGSKQVSKNTSQAMRAANNELVNARMVRNKLSHYVSFDTWLVDNTGAKDWAGRATGTQTLEQVQIAKARSSIVSSKYSQYAEKAFVRAVAAGDELALQSKSFGDFETKLRAQKIPLINYIEKYVYLPNKDRALAQMLKLSPLFKIQPSGGLEARLATLDVIEKNANQTLKRGDFLTKLSKWGFRVGGAMAALGTGAALVAGKVLSASADVILTELGGRKLGETPEELDMLSSYAEDPSKLFLFSNDANACIKITTNAYLTKVFVTYYSNHPELKAELAKLPDGQIMSDKVAVSAPVPASAPAPARTNMRVN